MKLSQDKHSAFVPNFLLGAAGGIQYLKLKSASSNPRKSQEKCLRAILNYGKDTVYGKEHNFSHILEAKTAGELFARYQEQVKASDYEDFRPYVTRMKNGETDILFQGKPVLYATTSGSTGEPKWIPISEAYLKNIYGKMNKVWLFNFIKNRPKVYEGYIVSIVGKQIEGYTPDGTIYGSVSGFTQKNCPGFVKKLYVSPSEVFDIEDYTARNYVIMRMGIERNTTLVVTANPSTMVEMQKNVDYWYDEYVKDIKAFAGNRPILRAYFDPAAASLIVALREAHVFARLEQANNDVSAGIKWTNMMFSTGRLRLSEKCVNVIKELQVYSYDEDASIKEGRDVVKKEMDHAVDALRYFCYSEVYGRRNMYNMRDIAMGSTSVYER